MLLVVASRILHFLNVNHDDDDDVHRSWSPPPSPRPGADDLILPLSASSQKTTFSETIPHFPPVNASIVLVICLLPISTALVFYCMSTLPISLAWPRTIDDVAQLGRELTAYTQSGSWPLLHVMGVMAISAVWKHAWSIPGSVIWVSLSFFLPPSPIMLTFPKERLGRCSLLPCPRHSLPHPTDHSRLSLCHTPLNPAFSFPHPSVSSSPRFGTSGPQWRL